MTNEEFIKSISYEGEEWKDIPGYEGFYKASSLGRVISLHRVIIRKTGAQQTMQPILIRSNDGSSGYHYITLCKYGHKKKLPIHRVIAFAFLDNPDNKPIIDHINGNKEDNRVSNLRWATYSENMKNENTVQKFRLTFSEKGRSVVQLKDNKLIRIYQYSSETKHYGFVPSNVRKACNHIYSQHKGYQWMYIDEYNDLLEKDQSLN